MHADTAAETADSQLRPTTTANSSHFLQSPRVHHQTISPQLTDDAQQVIEIINQQEKRNFRLGVFFIAIAIVSWMLGLQLVNSVLKGDDYNKPFCLAVITGGCFSFNLVPELLNWIRSSTDSSDSMQQTSKNNNESTPLLPTRSQNCDASQHPYSGPAPSTNSLRSPASQLQLEYHSETLQQELTPREVTILALQLTIIYYAYNVFGMASLQFTSASNQTVLGSTTAIFTLFIGKMLKLDSFSIKKIFCVIISLMGVVFINISQRSSSDFSDNGHGRNKYEPKNPPLGNALALLAAFFYALYLIIMKLRCGTGTKTTNERRLFGFMGLFTLLLGIPTLFLVHILQIERFEFPPPNNTILTMVLLNAFLSYISDFVTILAMLLTSPLVTSLALTSSIPITIFTDYLILHFTRSDKTSPPSSPDSHLYMYTCGILSILVSVVLINVDIVSENEYIEDVIENALESAIRHDEVLSPIFSPLLEPSPSHSAHQSREQNQEASPMIGFGYFASPRFKHLRATPASAGESLKTQSQQAPPLSRKISQFRLDPSENNYEDNQCETVSESNQASAHTALTGPANMLVYGGINHQYRVAHLDSSLAVESAIAEQSGHQAPAKSPSSLNSTP